MLINKKIISLKDGRAINLKSPEPKDAAQLLAHLQVVFRESYRNMNHPAGHFDNFPAEKEAEILQNFADSQNQFMISAFEQDRIIGNLGCFGKVGEFLKHSAHIGMGINQQFCGAGLGKAMLNYAIDSAKTMGIHRLELTVRAFNQPGIKLYEKCGFELVGRLKDMAFIDGEFHDELYYQLIL
jgi:RimJ/RimL family protein N-acetyltransferase